MSIADLKARTQQIVDTFNTHDPVATAAFFAPTAELRDIKLARPMLGPAQIAAAYATYLTAIPDAYVYIDRLVAEGDTVVAEWTSSGTHRGALMGIPATGKPICFKGVSIFKYRAGLVIAKTQIWDLAGVLRQLGLLPEQE